MEAETDTTPAQPATALSPPSERVSPESKRQRRSSEINGAASSSLVENNPLLQCIPGMVFRFIVDRDGSSRFSYVTHYCQRIFNVTSPQILASPDEVFSLVTPSDRQSFHETLMCSMSTLQIWDWKGRIQLRDGVTKRVVHFDSSTPPVRNAETGSTEWNGVVFDITDHYGDPMQDMGLRDVLDCAPHPVIALDTAGLVTEWNGTAEKLTGYPKSEVLGRNFVGGLVMGACHRDVTRMLDEAMLHGRGGEGGAAGAGGGANNSNKAAGGAARTKTDRKDPSCEATLQTKPGHPPVHLLLTASPKKRTTPLPDTDDDQITGAVIIAQDLSKQHAALAMHRSETERGITEWLSHEVRNPLSVAVEASRTLKEDPSDDPEENSNNLELICLSLGYIVELLTDMLDLNKCVEGKITMNPGVCRIREDIILPTKRMLDQRRKSVDLVIEGGEEIVAHVDRLRLQQVLTNLIVNSMKYTSVGFIRVGMRKIRRGEMGGSHLECATGQTTRFGGLIQQQEEERSSAGEPAKAKGPTIQDLFGGGEDSSFDVEANFLSDVGAQPEKKQAALPDGEDNDECAGVLLSVSDSGTGIDPSNYLNLFERWERLGSKTNGTGIGLCLCRSLMEVMGGRIFLSKTYNSGLAENPGCQFRILLPPSVLEVPKEGADGSDVGLLSAPGDVDGGSAICTDALSKRLSRDKKTEGALATDAPNGKSASPQQSKSDNDLFTPRDTGGGEPAAIQDPVPNGQKRESGKTVSFAIHHETCNPPEQTGTRADGDCSADKSNCVAPEGNHGGTLQQKAEGKSSASAAVAASTKHNSDPFHNTCLQGKFRLLVVDDDETFRIMFCRRLRRILPNAIVDESPSGEDSIDKAKGHVYDLITMDHFMALDGLNGADTIRGLRANNCDACIVGISGNTKTAHHLEAGADDFVRKPVPDDRKLLRRLVTKMSPPGSWRVLVADDSKLNLKFMHRKLVKVSSPHYMTKKDAEKRWKFALKENGEDCVECLKKEWFDLVVLDQHMGPGLKGTDVAEFVRSGAMNPRAIVVINTGMESSLNTQEGWDEQTSPFNFQWRKPAPSIERIRQDLCLELVKAKTPSGSAFIGSLPKMALKAPGNDSSTLADMPADQDMIEDNQDEDNQEEDNQDDVASTTSDRRVDDENSYGGDDSSQQDGAGTMRLPQDKLVLQKLYDEIEDDNVFSDMCNLFATTVPGQLNHIDELIDKADWERLALVLHTLKGTLQVFHLDWVTLAKPFLEFCRGLEAHNLKRKLGDDEPSSATDEEVKQMRQYAEQQRLALGEVVGVCREVVSEKDGDQITGGA